MKETIRIQLNKMHKFKQFMDEELFTDLTKAASRTHLRKPEMISIMRAKALKYSELGEYEKALSCVENVKNKCANFYENPMNPELLLNMQNEIEILKKKNVVEDAEVNKKIIEIAKQSMEMAVKIYGEKTFITNLTILTYALALSKCEEMH